MKGICGNEKASNALVSVDLDVTGISIEIKSKLKKMFGNYMEKAVRESLNELNIENASVIVEDFGALDFVIKGRTKTAIERTLKNGGKN